ncbi:NADH:flavin oxidoreductase/NADH oxidase [Homoserinimonas hongtaonis]|uniref:NADH:flavin oxidoreductase/NADH oxidase n=1 Tax=Homoserinimonas hongtaonis TaxID=2079791 RepID=UPI002410FEB9|nr:NADH:flavin oxidoreductase/NADH oxidase [Salinibacterium hongtaonis]
MSPADISLFSPLTLRSITMRNRLWVAPMCQYEVVKQDGVPTEWHLVHLGSFARGGAGLVMTEATAVSPEGRISGEDTGIYTDEQRDAWSRIVDFIHAQGAPAGIQLAHAGRKGSRWREWLPDEGTRPVDAGGWRTVAPSEIPFEGYDTPIALDLAGIDAVVADFAAAARRAVEAGFDVVEVHAAHGYLIHQFLSPLSNRRTDAYGGSLDNRSRLLLRVIEAVREAIGPDRALFVRLSATDWADEGWSPDETAIVASAAHELGADLFDISTGGTLASPTIPLSPGYQVPFAAAIREATGAPVSAVGLITTSLLANEVIASGQADAVMMGRKLLRDPHFALRAALELGVDIDYWPKNYDRARTTLARW